MATDVAPVARLALLGAFQLRVRGETVPVPLVAQRLLAFLALHPQPIHRVHVAGKLWYAKGDASAQASLRTALWRLRNCCGEVRPVVSTRSHLQLANDITVDVREQIVAANRAIAGDTALSDRTQLALLDGELLPDWYEDWVLVERDRMGQLRLHALEAIAGQLRAAERYCEAIEILFAVLRADSLRESAHRCLIETLLAEGNRIDAIRHYVEYRERIGRRFGLAPSTELQALVAGLQV